VAQNCGATPDTLIESELFGHARGAFTGAVADRAGLFETAAGGTLFLDEIGDASPLLQMKLLRVLQEGEARRVGDTRARRVDVRVVCATHRCLEQAVQGGGFRADLYFRLNAVRLRLPSLRERGEDVVLLARHFLGEAAARAGRSPFLAGELAAGAQIDPALIAKGAASGDEECIGLVISSGASIGNILAKLVNFFNPSLIVISGGLTGLGERFIASIREAIYRRSTPLAAADLVVKKSAILEKCGMTGAAILVLDEVFSHRNVGRLMRGLS
jgi:hypothetical protein